MNWSDRRRRFRALIHGERCVFPGSVFDPLSARIAESLGFEVGMFAGSVASMTVLGDPDLIVLTLSEFADQAHRICRAGNLSLLVDADHGYGNALNVKRTVEELETAGVCGLSIEDTELPAVFDRPRAQRLLSVEEGAGKMRAAIEGRQDPDLVLAGRTSAVRISDVDDAIRRLRCYQDAGVDALFVVGIRTRGELEAIASKVELPLILGGAPPDLMDRDYLSARGVRICLQGHAPFSAAVKAVHDTLKALRDGVAPGDLANLPSPDLMKRLTRVDDYDSWIDGFLT